MNNKEDDNYSAAGTGSVVGSWIAALLMIAATAFLIPPLTPEAEFGLLFSFPSVWMPSEYSILANTLLIAAAVIGAALLNKKYSFVRSSDTILPTAMTVILASNPVNTSYLGSPVFMLIVNLICLDIIMRSYHSPNATTSLFAIATWLSFGSMVQYAFLLMMLVYPVMAIMIKAFRLKEIIAYLMGLVAPYWVAYGFGLVSVADFRLPSLPMSPPAADGGLMLCIFVSLGTLALLGLFTVLNNAMLTYSGNMRVRTLNRIINFLGFASLVFMVADFDNFGAYAATFCFASAVQISNAFALRRIPHGAVWLWSVLSIFIFCFLMMLLAV
ncbi:MAG: hypothetical protein K2K93_03975 [Muribaculaceae bacterium]|nr:hypothetical protein [Muribaculaceae bacterium]